jgi:hypothetical protein
MTAAEQMPDPKRPTWPLLKHPQAPGAVTPCFRCGKPVGPDGWLSIASSPKRPGGKLRYPSETDSAGYFSCRRCGVTHADMSYDIAIDRVRNALGDSDSLFDWKRHLYEKEWFPANGDELLEIAHHIANRDTTS